MPEEIKVLGKKFDYEISEEDFILGFEGWKESTSTSPSGSLKLLWGKQLVYQGEDNNCFGKQQHGSCPQHQAINAVHMKTLTYHLTRILCHSLIMFDNDATGCFDCIIVSLVMIAALQLGMP
jgi:hypothetical protein